MEKQHYTPDPEEFHIGFIYEYPSNLNFKDLSLNRVDLKLFDPKRWKSKEVGYRDELIGYDGEDHLDTLLPKELIRVKYLDRQDVVDLEFSMGKPYIFEKIVDTGKATIEVFWWSEAITRWVLIKVPNALGEMVIGFYGEIKNKSELKKVLQMIGIL